MDRNICKTIVANKSRFIPHLFTERQVIITQRYLQNKALTNTEKTYFYSTIKKKMASLALLKEEWHIKGSGMIPERVEEAKQILKEINNEKTFISGSFLYAKNYNDIDIFVVGKRRKQYREGKKNFIFITENDLSVPLFYSCFQYSVSNFCLSAVKPRIKQDEMDEFLLAYQLAITEIFDNEDQKTSRYIIFLHEMHVKQKVLNSYELYKEFEEMKKKSKEEKIKIVNGMIKDLLLHTFSKRYTYEVLRVFNKDLETTMAEYKNNGQLIIYHNLLEEVKHECRRNQAATA